MQAYDPNKEIIEINNFFPKYMQKELLQTILSKNIGYTYLPNVSSDKPQVIAAWSKNGKIQDTDGFTYRLPDDEVANNKVVSYVEYYINKNFNIQVKKFLRVIFAILPPNPTYKDGYTCVPHVDMIEMKFKNFLYYANDNDAPTLFFNQRFNEGVDIDFSKQEIIHKVYPKQGKAVLWDGSIFHAASVSKLNKRVTLNVVFI